jgi:hypothetical protein
MNSGGDAIATKILKRLPKLLKAWLVARGRKFGAFAAPRSIPTKKSRF